MKISNPLLTLAVALACAALTFSLPVRVEAQTFTVVSSFDSQHSVTLSAFVQGINGDLYNVSDVGGTGTFGLAYSMTPTGEITDLYSFCLINYPTCVDGFNPTSLILGKDGNFYGTTSGGGTTFGGVIFKLTPGGKQSTLYTLCPDAGCPDGAGPNGIVLGSDGNFYGTTATTIFRVSPSGTFKVLFTFPCSRTTCPSGMDARVPPIQGINGNFYGTTADGGIKESGVVYEITPAGHYSVLHKFCSQANCTDGIHPTELVQDASGTFYGIAANGGASGKNGTLFKITPAKQFIVLHTFESGVVPWSLTIANDGNMYGTTLLDNASGTFGKDIFQITPEGVYTPLHQFTPDELPGHLFQATDGILYGTTTSGGALGYGEAFSFSLDFDPLVKTVPLATKVGNGVFILGNHLTGSTSVTFNGVPAEFKVLKDTLIRATVPEGATTGTLSVVTPSRTLNSYPQFVVKN